MRSIKFRAWEIEQCLMIYNIQTAYDSTFKARNSDEYVNGDSFGEFLGNKYYIVEQWTGLLDKNGVEIYEGDIVRTFDWMDEEGNKTENMDYPVKWSEEYLGWMMGEQEWMLSDWESVEVIGNIHEHE